jgi:uncharacterized protein with PIN domain
VRFYAELNDHLSAPRQYKTLERTFFTRGTVKDLIESFGVPHTEVELIVANGVSVPFDHIIHDGERIAVYPKFESFDVTPELQVRREPLRESRFVLDVHLGKLAAYLRMLGFDTSYRNCYSDPQLVRISVEEERILLTRDRGVLKHAAVTHGYLMRETDSHRQLAEVVSRFDLARSLRPFTRCMGCNGVLSEVRKEEVSAVLPPRAASEFDEFRQCGQCGKVYWKGSHYRRMLRWVEELSV